MNDESEITVEKKSSTATQQTNDAFAGFKAASETQRQALVTCLEAAAEMGVQADRLVRAQVGHQMAAARTAQDFMTQSIDSAFKTQETLRKATVDYATQAFA